MTGVEILSSQPIYNTYLPEWCALIGVLLVFVTLMVSVELLVDYRFWGIVTLLIGAIFSISLICLALSSNKASVKYWEHKVIIDDSVSMTEFMKKYEPIEQDGKIWIIKEKIND